MRQHTFIETAQILLLRHSTLLLRHSADIFFNWDTAQTLLLRKHRHCLPRHSTDTFAETAQTLLLRQHIFIEAKWRHRNTFTALQTSTECTFTELQTQYRNTFIALQTQCRHFYSIADTMQTLLQHWRHSALLLHCSHTAGTVIKLQTLHSNILLHCRHSAGT